MSDSKNELTFQWNYKSFHLLRLLFALFASGTILYLVFTYAAQPYIETLEAIKSSEKDARKSIRAPDIVKQVSLENLSIEQLSLTEAEYIHELWRQNAHQSIQNEVTTVIEGFETENRTHVVTFSEIPFQLPTTTQNNAIELSFPSGELPKQLYTTPPPTRNTNIEVEILGNVTQKNATAPPLPKLDIGTDHISYECVVAPNGGVLYALPIQAHNHHPKIEEWIQKQIFSPSEKSTIVRITFSAQPSP